MLEKIIWSLDFGGKDYTIFGLYEHTFDRRWIFFYREGDNNYSISMTTFDYNSTLLFEHWLLSCFAAKTLEAACNFIKKRLHYKRFLAKLLRTSIFKNNCERLLLQDFIIITIAFEGLKVLLPLCRVIVFADLFYKNILSFLLCYLSSSELTDYQVETFFPKIFHTWKNSYSNLHSLKSFLVISFRSEERYN